MAKRVIEVHYHPAIKEVNFKTEDGKPFEPDQLKQWQYDKFILQEHGEDFFDSIAEALDEADKIAINFFGTQIDYEDFCEMVKFYNKSKDNNRFIHKQSGVLLGMDEMYREAEKFGDKAVEKLKRKLVEIDIAGGSNSIKDDFKAELETYIEQIDSKIRNLQSTGINICFVGTYSAGKSSLINAILGEKILPEEDESKTAKFYLIDQPVVNERERIRFDIDDDSINENNTIFADFFFRINSEMFKKSKISSNENIVNPKRQQAALSIIINNTREMLKLLNEYNQPQPTEIKLVYNNKQGGEFDANYSYEEMTIEKTSDRHLSKIWFESL